MEVNQATGEVHVSRVVVGHDAGLMINPAGVRHQVHGNVIQTASRALTEKVERAPGSALATNREWGSYPILNFRQVPVIDVVTLQHPGDSPLGAGESASVPGTAAIANAIFDATGVRFRSPPFTPEVIRAGLQRRTADAAEPLQRRVEPARQVLPAGARLPSRVALVARAALLLGGMLGLAGALLGWRSAIAPTALASVSPYTVETLERGRVLAEVGDCAVCHTAKGGARNAGGRALETPFGTVFSTNLTPDVNTGIGSWSLAAFEHAMRQGISRDGHYLYPAFPYTAFAKMTEDDLTALYAHLMSQTPVRAPTPTTALRFPMNLRPLMAGWNALFHDPSIYRESGPLSSEWARGEYLVTGVGHCGACHTERNWLGAEKSGTRFLAGAMADGWEAPALTALTRAPVPWTREELFRYLRDGTSEHHGIAGGPMGPVVLGLRALPDGDIRAMALYLASFNAPNRDPVDLTRSVIADAVSTGLQPAEPTQRLFDGACGACHHDGSGPQLMGQNLPFALNTNLHSARPDNLIHTILEGIRDPVHQDIGFMPAFADAFTDEQIARLARYMRARFAPSEPRWDEVEPVVTRLRSAAVQR